MTLFLSHQNVRILDQTGREWIFQQKPADVVHNRRMRKRPWEILLLTLVYALAPVGNLVFTCLVRGYDLTAVPYLVLALRPLDWLGLLVYPALAAAVWTVSVPGWWTFLGLNLGLLVLNVYQGSLVPGSNLVFVAGANLVNVAVASVLFFPHARSPYFSPRLRWWNSEVRYRIVNVLDVPVLLRQNTNEGQGLLLDLSKTGCFVDLPPGFSLGDPVDLEFECWGLTIRGRGRILRQSAPEDALQGYGIQFSKMTADQKHHFEALVQTLKAHHVPSREEVVVLKDGVPVPRQPGVPVGKGQVNG